MRLTRAAVTADASAITMRAISIVFPIKNDSDGIRQSQKAIVSWKVPRLTNSRLDCHDATTAKPTFAG